MSFNFLPSSMGIPGIQTYFARFFVGILFPFVTFSFLNFLRRYRKSFSILLFDGVILIKVKLSILTNKVVTNPFLSVIGYNIISIKLSYTSF